MKRIKAPFIIIILAICFLWVSNVRAATINAASCSQSDVQSAIDSATTGDTVLVPPGSCTWLTTVTISNNKKITLRGAGYNNTVITSSTDMLYMNLSGSRVTGIGFIITGTGTPIIAKGSGWRIDNCKFDNVTGASRVAVSGSGVNVDVPPVGLVDNCVFINCRVVAIGMGTLAKQSIEWAKPLDLGSAEAVYVEDCEFTRDSGNAIDTNYGGSYVFRYNIVNDSSTEAHSVQGNHRASRKWEIYNNTFNQVSRGMWAPMFLRGGTGVVFNNTLTGSWSLPKIALGNVRSCSTKNVSGSCDGSSSWDGNEAGKAGYPCRDQIGRSTDKWLWTVSNPYPPQAHEPAYAWNNKHGEKDVVFYQHNCDLSKAHIQPGRDYFNNVPKPGYTPYTYPHPLTKAWSNLQPPKNPGILK